MFTFTQQQKDEVVRQARKKVKEIWPDSVDVRLGLCLYSTMAMIEELRSYPVRAILQAGSCQWRCAPDSAPGSTYFGYVYDDGTEFGMLQNKVMQELGWLPEIHAWVGLPETNEIIDIETGRFPTICKAMIDTDWTTEVPPDYLWEPIEKIKAQHDCYYAPDMRAIKDAYRFLIKNGIASTKDKQFNAEYQQEPYETKKTMANEIAEAIIRNTKNADNPQETGAKP